METIHVVLEDELLRATNRAARRAKVSRSAFVRNALCEHLRRHKIKELEAGERRAYQKQPEDVEEVEHWERVAAWPVR